MWLDGGGPGVLLMLLQLCYVAVVVDNDESAGYDDMYICVCLRRKNANASEGIHCPEYDFWSPFKPSWIQQALQLYVPLHLIDVVFFTIILRYNNWTTPAT